MFLCRKVVKNTNESSHYFGKLAPTPDFPNQGCYFFTIPEDYMDMVEENKVYLFKYFPAKEVIDPVTKKQKVDKRGKPIYNRIAIPLREMPFDDPVAANAFVQDIKAILRRERL